MLLGGSNLQKVILYVQCKIYTVTLQPKSFWNTILPQEIFIDAGVNNHPVLGGCINSLVQTQFQTSWWEHKPLLTNDWFNWNIRLNNNIMYNENMYKKGIRYVTDFSMEIILHIHIMNLNKNM